jgi:hypothetical protein
LFLPSSGRTELSDSFLPLLLFCNSYNQVFR